MKFLFLFFATVSLNQEGNKIHASTEPPTKELCNAVECGYGVTIEQFIAQTVPMEITKLFCGKNASCSTYPTVKSSGLPPLCMTLKDLALNMPPNQSNFYMSRMYNMSWNCSHVDRNLVSEVLEKHNDNYFQTISGLSFQCRRKWKCNDARVKPLCLAVFLMLGYPDARKRKRKPIAYCLPRNCNKLKNLSLAVEDEQPTSCSCEGSNTCPAVPMNVSAFNFTIPWKKEIKSNGTATQKNGSCSCSCGCSVEQSTNPSPTTAITSVIKKTTTSTPTITHDRDNGNGDDDHGGAQPESSAPQGGSMGLYYVIAVLVLIILAVLGYFLYSNKEKVGS